MKTKEKYGPQIKYDLKNTTQFKIKLNYKTDADIIKWLDKQSNKQGAVKELIRKAIKEDIMKVLVNSLDKEIRFTEIKKAKKFYIPSEELPCSEDEYLGEDYPKYCKQWAEYKKELEEAADLEELADVLNRYTDIFDNGSTWKVKEI